MAIITGISIRNRQHVESTLQVDDKTDQRLTLKAAGLRFKTTEKPVLEFKQMPDWPLPSVEGSTAHSLLLGPRDTLKELPYLAVECNVTLSARPDGIVVAGIVTPFDAASASGFEALLNVLIRGLQRWPKSFPDYPLGVNIELRGEVRPLEP